MSNENIAHSGFIGLLAKCVDIFENKFKPKLTTVTSSVSFSVDWVFMLFLAKSMKTARAIVMLAESGYGEDATCLARSVFENYIHLAYILKEDTKGRAELFLKHGKLDFLRKIENLPGNPSSKKTEIEELEELFCVEFAKACAKYKDGTSKYSWSCLSLRKMSCIVKAEKEYDKLYSWMSQYSHPHSEGLQSYSSIGQIDDSPGHSMVEEALVLSLSSIIQLLNTTNEKQSLGLEKDIEEINLNFKDLLDQASA